MLLRQVILSNRMEEKINHIIIPFQLLFAKKSLLSIFIYFLFLSAFFIDPIRRFSTTEQLSISSYEWWVFPIILIFSFLIQLMILESRNLKYNYSIENTYISIFYGGVQASIGNLGSSESGEFRFQYKDIKSLILKQDLVGKLAGYYILHIYPRSSSISDDLKIKYRIGKIYGLNKNAADNLVKLISEKMNQVG